MILPILAARSSDDSARGMTSSRRRSDQAGPLDFAEGALRANHDRIGAS
jgi:hypothetical protein